MATVAISTESFFFIFCGVRKKLTEFFEASLGVATCWLQLRGNIQALTQ
jgi:hypothetical protein